MRSLEDEHWWFVARRRIIAAMLRKVRLPHPAEILEVGCGTGGNFAMLKEFGRVTGVEQDVSALTMARERDIAPVLQGELPDRLPGVSGKFDLIALFDVIEHVEEDRASLEYLAGLLRPGGRIILTVPAFNFLWSQHDDENHHKRRYRRRDIRSLSSKCGLRVDYLSYFNFWLFPPVAAVRLFRKLVPAREAWQDMQQPGAVVNRLLETILGSESGLVGKVTLPFGISLIAVLSPVSAKL